MENTGSDASWLNGNNSIHNRIIHSMVRSGLLDSNQREKKHSALQQIHHQKFIDTNYTVHYTITHLIWHGMVKIPSSINSEPLDMIYTPSPILLKC